MKRIFKQLRKKFIPNLFLLTLLIQNLIPLSFLISSPVKASIHLDPANVSADFNAVDHQLAVTVKEPLELEYLVEYQDQTGATQAVQGKTQIVEGGTRADVYFGTCSATDCVPADFQTGKLIFPNTDYQADFTYVDEVLWLTENGVATVAQVEAGKTYVAPQNDQVQVTFTQLPARPGSLSIQEVYLTEDQVAATGAVSNVAYDITSDMENGTFRYDLKLPVPADNTGEVQVKYAESLEELAQATEVASEHNGNEVVAKELNHFTVYVVTFETPDYSTGNINGQDGWFKTGLFDSEVDSSLGVSGFGSQSLRISNAITSGSFGDQTFAKPLSDSVGELDATVGSFSEGTRQTHFEMSFDIASTILTEQPGMAISVSPDRGDGSRMSYLSFSDNSTGIAVTFYDVQGTSNPANFVGTSLGELNRSSSHSIKLVMDMVDGPSNDIVKVYIDGSLVHTGTSWENYYRYDSEASAEQSPRIIKTIIFRVAGIAVPANLGNGYLFDNISLMSSPSVVKDIHFTNTGTPVIGGSTSSINLEVQATYPTYGVDRVRFRYAPPSETCEEQYVSPYFNNIGDGTKNGDLYSIDWDVSGLPSGEYTACALMHRGSGVVSEGYTNENHAEFKVVVDNNSPAAPAIVFPTEGQNFISTPILNDWTEPTDPSGIDHYRVEYKYDDGHTFSGFPYRETTASQRNHTPSNSEQGGVSFRVQAFDGLGNEGAWSEWRHYYFDKEAPAAPANLRRYIKGTSTELACGDITKRQTLIPIWDSNTESDFDHYEYSSFNPGGSQGLNEEILYTNEKMHSWVPPVDGTYGFAVRAVDEAGNKSAWSLAGESLEGSCQITYDSVAPDVEITAPAAGLVTGVVDIRGTVEDTNPHHYWFVIQNSGGTTVAGPGVVNDTSSFTDELLLSWDVSSLPDGEYTIKLEARDAADNKDSGSVHWVKVLVDNTQPSSTITTFEPDQSGQTIETNTFDGLIEGTATDGAGSGVAHVLLSVGHYSFEDGLTGLKYWDKYSATWVTGEVLFQAIGADNWSYQLPDVPEGVYTITSHAVDVAGNQETTFVITIVYDKTIPEVTLSINPASPDAANGWYKTQPTITLAATDNYELDKIEYHWNSDGWSTYSSALTPPGEGQNILYYRGVDKVGNTTEVGVKEVKYDATVPVDGPLNLKVENITLDSAIGKWEKPATSSDITRYVLSWKHESGDSNGTEVGADVFQHEMKNLYNGEWTLYVKAMDDAGNFKEASQTFRIGPAVGGTTTTTDVTVLGATTDDTNQAVTLGQVAGATTEEDNQEDTTEPTEEPTDNSQVLGATDEQCSGFTANLPWIILLVQGLMMLLAEVALKKTTKKVRTLVFWGLALLSPVVFYVMRNEACYGSFIYNWFVLPSLAVTVFARLTSYFFIEDLD